MHDQINHLWDGNISAKTIIKKTEKLKSKTKKRLNFVLSMLFLSPPVK